MMKKAATQWMEEDFKRLQAPIREEALFIHHFSKPSITYGYFRDPASLLNMKEIEAQEIEIARRPTGGGVLFHFYDLSFSILIPKEHPQLSTNPVENYRWINGRILDALQKKGILGTLYTTDSEKGARYPFCSANPTIYDIFLDGKKVGGAAQRRTKEGLLHHGSLFLHAKDGFESISPFLLNREALDEMRAHSGFIPLEREEVIDSLAAHFRVGYDEAYGKHG